MAIQEPVSEDDPRMIAWESYKKTADFTNSRRWAITSKQTVEYPNLDGSLWAVFIEGFQAGQDAYTREPIPMILNCPKCGMQHIDAPEPDSGWDNPPHKSHKCRPQDGGCGTVWRPADVATVGVREIKTRGDADTWQPSELY